MSITVLHEPHMHTLEDVVCLKVDIPRLCHLASVENLHSQLDHIKY